MTNFTRTCALALLGAAGSMVACGHLAFVDLPADEDAAVGAETGTVDGGDLVDASGDGSNVVDAGVDAGPCQGPTCIGTYVSGTIGNDANPGTSARPVQTIKAGLAIAVKLGGKQNVYVAATHYPEKVTLAEGVHLLGGYDCDATTCTWTRDVLKNDTAILDQDFEGVLAPATVTRKTVLDGFRVAGKGGAPSAGPGSVAMSLVSGTPTVTRCRFGGGDVTGAGINARSIGLAVFGPSNDPAGALIAGNGISGGTSTGESIGLFVAVVAGGAKLTAVAVVTANTIRSGAAPFTSGVVAWGSGPGTLLQNNSIAGGTSSNSMNTSASWGITVESTMTIDANRINTDPALSSGCTQSTNGNFCGGIHSAGSTSTITNNVVLGGEGPKTCAVLLEDGELGLGGVILNGNTLDGAGSGGLDGKLSTAVALRINAGVKASVGKVRNNILIGGLNKGRYGVYEDAPPGKVARVVALDNNDFFNAGTPRSDFAYRLWNGTAATDILFAQLAGAALGLATPPTANLNVDPLLDVTFHIKPTSPMIDMGTPTEAPKRDIDDESRPKGTAVDIGADEAK